MLEEVSDSFRFLVLCSWLSRLPITESLCPYCPRSFSATVTFNQIVQEVNSREVLRDRDPGVPSNILFNRHCSPLAIRIRNSWSKDCKSLVQTIAKSCRERTVRNIYGWSLLPRVSEEPMATSHCCPFSPLGVETMQECLSLLLTFT